MPPKLTGALQVREGEDSPTAWLLPMRSAFTGTQDVEPVAKRT